MATKELVGTVISDKLMNTRIVAVSISRPHKNYKKVVKKTKRYVAHDDSFNSKIGDKVKIEETRPLSKTKKWVITNILLEKISI
jgi:small subunit ribosomal protein S17